MIDARAFWDWFSENEAALRGLSGAQVAEAIYAELTEVDQRLGVEVQGAKAPRREVIFTAYGDAEAFPAVESLVEAAPAIAGWSFVALKPARGFDFSVDAGEIVIDAAKLIFDPLRSPQAPNALAIRFFVASELAESGGIEEVLWLILETGLGERAAAEITHIEAAAESDASGDELAIGELSGYIRWHKSKRGAPN